MVKKKKKKTPHIHRINTRAKRDSQTQAKQEHKNHSKYTHELKVIQFYKYSSLKQFQKLHLKNNI